MLRFRELLPLYAVIFLGFLGYALTITLFIPMLMDKHLLFLPVNDSTSVHALPVVVMGVILLLTGSVLFKTNNN